MKHHRTWLFVLAVLAISPAYAQSGKAAKFYEDALKRFEVKDLDGAEVQLKNALREDNRWLPALLLMGQVALANNNPGAAEGAYLGAIEQGASRSEVILPLGQAFMHQGKHGQMIQDTRLQPGPDLPPLLRARVHLMRAAAFVDLGDDRSASTALAAAKELRPELPEVWLTEVTQKIRSQQLDAADVAIAQAVKLAPNSVEVLYQRAALHHVRNRLDAALVDYGAVLAQQPQHLEALVARAGIAIDLGQFDVALADITAARKLQPREPRAAYLGALLAESRGERAASQAAMHEVTSLIDGAPPEMIRFRPQVLMLAGLAHHALGQAEKARPYLELVLKQQPRSPVNKLLAQVLMELGQTENALVVLENYLKVQPQDFQALAMLASGHTRMGRHAKATQIMSQALARQDNSQLRAILGQSLMRSGKWEEAQRELETAWKRNPKDVSAGFSLAMLHLASQQPTKAMAVVKPLVAVNPKAASLHHLLGMVQAALGDPKSARDSFEKALSLDKDLVEPHLSLARLEAQGGQQAVAAKRLEALVTRNPKQLEPLLELATLSLRQRQPDAAARWLERAISEAGPRDIRGHLAMVSLQLARGQNSEAVRTSRAASERAPDDPTALATYGRALVASGDPKSARQPLVNAGRRVTDDPSAWVEVARLQIAAQDPSGASYTLGKVLELQPAHPVALGLQVTVDLLLKEVESAARRSQQLLNLRPREASSHLLAADVAAARQQPSGVLAAVRKAHEVQPSKDTALKLVAASRLQDPTGASAQAVGEAWLRQQPQDRDMLHALAELSTSRQQWPTAKARYEQILKLQANDARALNNLAGVLLRLNDPAGSQVRAEAALKTAPGQPLVMDTLAWALHRQGQHEKALGLLRDARARAPEHAEIRFHLAAVLAATGRLPEARTELEAALARKESLESVKEAQELSRSLK